MSRLPPLPQLDWNGAAPVSREHGDVYFSGDGLAEKRCVFLTGCGLPEAWAARERFTIGELGFGSGLNVLALMELWRAHRPSPSARLDILSFEGALMTGQDAARVHSAWPELDGLSRELVARWPVRARGLQRMRFPGGVALTIFIDDIAAALPQARASINAWFFDGFAPSKNPAMWSAEVMAQVARLSASGARAASYAVAGDVRRNLAAAGFAVEKKPGHGRKKERLEAILALRTDHLEEGRDPPSAPASSRRPGSDQGLPRDERALSRSPPKSVLVIGAGIAGACTARAFLERGCEVTVADKADGPGAEASGNPLALVMPRLDATDTPAARALLAAYLYALGFYHDLGEDAAQALKATHRPRGAKDRQKFARLMADPPVDDRLLQAFDAADPGAGVIHCGAMAVRPAVALPRLLQGARLCFKSDVRFLDPIEAGLIVICAGMGLSALAGPHAPPLAGRLGQLEAAPSHAAPCATADGGYAVEAFGQLVFGATFKEAHGEPQVTPAARAQNLETLARLRPDLKPAALSSRAAIRATTPDRFPVVGAPPVEGADNKKAPGSEPAPFKLVRLIGGLGARGFLWAPLLAEFLASEVFGEPLPLEAGALEDLDPSRFIRRARRRGGA